MKMLCVYVNIYTKVVACTIMECTVTTVLYVVDHTYDTVGTVVV